MLNRRSFVINLIYFFAIKSRYKSIIGALEPRNALNDSHKEMYGLSDEERTFSTIPPFLT